MKAEDLQEKHIGGVYRLADGTVILLQDYIQGDKAVLLQTDKGSITVSPLEHIQTIG